MYKVNIHVKTANDSIVTLEGVANRRVIVVDGENWPNGIIGIVAAKLVELFGKPAIVIARDGEEARGCENN